MAYEPQEWRDGEDGGTPLSAARLNHLEQGVAEAAEAADEPTAWPDVTGKPATFPPTVGTTSTTAKAGNYVPAWGEVTGKPATFPPAAHAATLVNVAAVPDAGVEAGTAQAAIAALAARIAALEDAATEGGE